MMKERAASGSQQEICGGDNEGTVGSADGKEGEAPLSSPVCNRHLQSSVWRRGWPAGFLTAISTIAQLAWVQPV